MELYVKDLNELKDVENFLFRFIYPKPFNLRIIIRDPHFDWYESLPSGAEQVFDYRTVYNDSAGGLILETI
jgi:hypothetical protein